MASMNDILNNDDEDELLWGGEESEIQPVVVGVSEEAKPEGAEGEPTSKKADKQESKESRGKGRHSAGGGEKRSSSRRSDSKKNE
mmetsp:Transcript_6598/g.10662  ORF Transcript_6598/g.10662 Transcript_6598/m.10662 type:complete len:85 (-) Transcript_6598:176-430(-)|eukprot:CAMPEP_0194672580 /NCGR_PEP_ID=MMETSP0295-20121207/6544_1 /TAXON_ID=39354 /ORGANISM="Heterosigma akashiwo, Strain CCMP2393" /LENGTH=84 /DNA_ID=CAMNT_0039556345 /DNA_START=57 /DNA_END=311 /DNA_ORIENTATION=+